MPIHCLFCGGSQPPGDRRRIAGRVCAALIIGTIGGVARAAQEVAPATYAVPAALLVPDRFARAVDNHSTAPSYLMVTIVNDTTGETRRVCLEGPQLFEALRGEHKIGRRQREFDASRRRDGSGLYITYSWLRGPVFL